MISVAEAEHIIMSQPGDFGKEMISFDKALGRILAEDIIADRDLPPCSRATMDGIAIKYDAIEQGIKTFTIIKTQAAADRPTQINSLTECVEIMTGAALDDTTDTVIRYEDLEVKGSLATLLEAGIKKGQNIHCKGIDKKQNELIIAANTRITPATIGILASIGKTQVLVRKNPKIVIISTGDELVPADEIPEQWQIRSSNAPTIHAVLEQHGINALMLHLPDEPEVMTEALNRCLNEYEVLIISGGVSMGKFDHIPSILASLAVSKLLHKVQQRPGKPFWFGKHKNGAVVFAFPGNPVSAFMCLHRYFLPWLHKSMTGRYCDKLYGVLDKELTFIPPLQYFLQVKLSMNDAGCLVALPVEGNGSGDFVNLAGSHAFMELPSEQTNFKKGAVYPIWPFKQMI